MATIRIDTFTGMFPKIHPEALPDNAAQHAVNIDFSAGVLKPLRNYGDPIGSIRKDVLGISAIYHKSGDRRWYHSYKSRKLYIMVEAGNQKSDGSFRVFRLISGNIPKYIVYTRGETQEASLPLSIQIANRRGMRADPHPVNRNSIKTWGRDDNNQVTIDTIENHGYNTGDRVTIHVPITASDDERTFRAQNVYVTVTGSKTFYYYSPGEPMAPNSPGTASVIAGVYAILAGETYPRSYVYTWINEWGAESIPSSPTPNIFVRDGQTVDVLDIPINNRPSNASGYRLYRSVSSLSGSEFLHVHTSYDGQPGSYTDEKRDSDLGSVLSSEEYDEAPVLLGMIYIHNNILAGFNGNSLYFSIPDKPSAWPKKFKIEFEDTIVSIVELTDYLIVFTRTSIWIVQGNDPATMRKYRFPSQYTCANKDTITKINNEVWWAATEGLISYSASRGIVNRTAKLLNEESWKDYYTKGLVGCTYRNQYIGYSDDADGFLFSPDEETGGNFTRLTIPTYRVMYNFPGDNKLYAFLTPTTVACFSSPGQPFVDASWRSKVFRLPKPQNMRAIRILGDYGSGSVRVILRAGKYGEIYNEVINDNGVRLLPSGYKYDMFSIELHFNMIVTGVHIAETPKELEEI